MKVLGLDLGVGSVGWALVDIDKDFYPISILGMGSRVINLSPDEKGSFANGKGETVCSQRTLMRTARKCLDRYQMRRKNLQTELTKLGMLDSGNNLLALNPLDMWQLRADAATDGHKLSLVEIGRVLLHINQKRGYRHAKDDDGDATQRDYVAKLNQRYTELKEKGMTPGQYFAAKLAESEQVTPKGGRVYTYRIRERVLPRKSYREEAEQILRVQSQFYPDILTEKVTKKLLDIIFYQRPLKSCKRLVSVCEFETKTFHNKQGKEVTVGPKVAPRTSPLAQVTRIYETVNNIVLVNYANKKRKRIKGPTLNDEYEVVPRDARLLESEYHLNSEERARVVTYLRRGEKLTETALLKMLGLKKSDGFRWEGAPKNGLPGDTTYLALKEIFSIFPDCEERFLRFTLEIVPSFVDEETGEIHHPSLKMTDGTPTPSPLYIDEPLYKLWHTVYSSSTIEELYKAMEKTFGITNAEIIDRLYKTDFVKPGYTNRSAKFMRRLLPLMMEGQTYYEACKTLGVNHSNSITTEENEARELIDRMPNLQKGELRQPIVEKILNQMVNVVNAVKDEFGDIDEIRVELARQLRQTKEQRAQSTKDIAAKERKNIMDAKVLTEHGIRVSRRNIQKYTLWKEAGRRCIYCGHSLNMEQYFGGDGEIEHIIPRSLFFDDSMSNKACSCHDCNKAKGQTTAYDFMAAKGEVELTKYLARVDDLFKTKQISKTKRMRLTTSKDEIPRDFLERDMRQTQYISRKAMEILKKTCRNVYASSGAVTDFLRHVWGYDMILQNLNLDRYAKAGLVEEIDVVHAGQVHKEQRIKDWSKRLDQRHHSIDALVVALTRQGYIQRLSNLSAERETMALELKHIIDSEDKKIHLLEEWGKTRPHFPVAMVASYVDTIAVSLKSGKKLTTPGKRYIHRKSQRILVQDGLNIPRGSLHNETVFGRIKMEVEIPIQEVFESFDEIINPTIMSAIKQRLEEYDGNINKAKKSVTKSPLVVILKGKKVELKAVAVYREVYAVRKPIASLTKPAIAKIIDPMVRKAVQNRWDECGDDEKKFKQSLEDNPIIVDGHIKRPVNSVRIWSIDKMVGVRKDTTGSPVGYAMPGANDHVAFYEVDGKPLSLVVSFWDAVRRKKYGLPSVVTHPDEVWATLQNLPDSEELQELSQSLPPYGSRFVGSMKMGDMFIMGLSEDEVNDAFRYDDMKTLSYHLYRVQKIAYNDYNFRLHTWTSVDAKKVKEDMNMAAYLRVQSYATLINLNPVPVIVDKLGRISRK